MQSFHGSRALKVFRGPRSGVLGSRLCEYATVLDLPGRQLTLLIRVSDRERDTERERERVRWGPGARGALLAPYAWEKKREMDVPGCGQRRKWTRGRQGIASHAFEALQSEALDLVSSETSRSTLLFLGALQN